MEAIAKLRFVRLSPRRARLVGDAIRGKSVEEAKTILDNIDNKPSVIIKKVLESAIANASNKDGMDLDSLYISKLTIDEGPTWKRFMPRAMGRATAILKKTSHISIVLSDGYKPKRKKRAGSVKKAKTENQLKEKKATGKKEKN